MGRKEKRKSKNNNKKKAVIIIIFIILIAICIEAVLLYQKSIVPEIELIGNSEIELNLDDEYVEEGAKANIKGNETDVEISGTVDTSIPGEYFITYLAKNEKNGNEAKITRKITVIDNIAPTIELLGREKVNVTLGEEYKEEGAEASDNIDGDITAKIVVNGTVDTENVGEYELEYTVEDNAGNSASIKRTVNVVEKKIAKSSNGLPVLMYHFFYDKTKTKPQDNNWMEITDFENQIKYLAENDFYFPDWQEVEDYIDGKIGLPEKSVVITVDDGDPSFFDLAVPIIQKYDAQATSFVITSWYGYRADNKEKNISYQSHSHEMHESGSGGKGRMMSWSLEKQVEDLKKSSEVLGGSTVFCYPFGHYNDTAKKALKESGYKLAFTIEGGRVYKGKDKYALPRVRISRGISLESFKKMVN